MEKNEELCSFCGKNTKAMEIYNQGQLYNICLGCLDSLPLCDKEEIE